MNAIIQTDGRYQQIEQSETDGWLTMQFHLESVDLARMLVFGLGEHAVVVAPQELKESILNTAQAMLDSAGV